MPDIESIQTVDENEYEEWPEDAWPDGVKWIYLALNTRFDPLMWYNVYRPTEMDMEYLLLKVHPRRAYDLAEKLLTEYVKLKEEVEENG